MPTTQSVLLKLSLNLFCSYLKSIPMSATKEVGDVHSFKKSVHKLAH